MASVLQDEETPEQVIQRLGREVEAVTQQSRVSHRMAVYWRAEYDKAERLRVRMERSLETWKRKLRELPKGQKPSDSELDLWAVDAEPTEANTPHQIW